MGNLRYFEVFLNWYWPVAILTYVQISFQKRDAIPHLPEAIAVLTFQKDDTEFNSM